MKWLHTNQKVIETCWDHMWSSPHATQKVLRSPLGQSMLCTADQLCQVPWVQIMDLTVPTIQTLISHGRSWVKSGCAWNPEDWRQSHSESGITNPLWIDAPCKASTVSKGTQSTIQQKTCFSVDLIDQFVRTASVVFTLPVLPSIQSSMTCLCLETSLPMQRSHWHLMLRHFCPKLVSRNSTATAISMHCIVRSLKLRRALRRGYTNSFSLDLIFKVCGPK